MPILGFVGQNKLAKEVTLKNVGERIRGRRRDLRISQFEVLVRMAAAGVQRTPPTLQSWEAGRVEPRADELLALADALDTSVGWLVGEKDEDDR